jgi:hypothetical protein
MTQPEWAIRCPWCEAVPDVRCLTPRGRRLPNGLQSHDARITEYAALEAAARDQPTGEPR